MKTSLAPLRLPAFRRLLAAYAINGVGFWFGETALAIAVLRETGSPTAVAAVFLAGQFAPALVTPVLVARLEALPRERVLGGLLLLEAALFTGLAATLAAGHFSLALVLAAVA